MSVRTRAYYLWEDDKNGGRPLLNDKQYYTLAQIIELYVSKYNFYKDAIIKDNSLWDECNICMIYLGKLECVKCKQKVCARCVLKLDSCPYCRNIKKRR